jgi:Tfp pilus assembly protein PilW
MLRTHTRRPQAGFTVTEVVVSMIITVEIIVVALFMFDFNARVTRAQTQLADLQQSQRVAQQDIARSLRLAGRGRFPVTRAELPGDDQAVPPFGFAVDVVNNVTSGTKAVAANFGTSPMAVEGTDILVIRGVMTSPTLSVLTAGSMTLNAAPATASAGTLTVDRVSAYAVEQDLSAFQASIDAKIPEAVLIISPAGKHVVVELDADNSSYTADQLSLAFKITGGKADNYRDLWTNDSPSPTGFPMENGASYVGILEEYRFYIREELEANPMLAQTETQLAPRLTRARLFPNTGLPWGSSTDPAVQVQVLEEDIADGIFDMQIALGYDTANGGGQMSDDTDSLGNDDRILEAATGVDDDWLFNAGTDDPTTVPFTQPPGTRPPKLHYVRISTLARSTRPDWKYEAAFIPSLEDRSYASDDTVNSEVARQYRRRTLQTTIDLRNL